MHAMRPNSSGNDSEQKMEWISGDGVDAVAEDLMTS